MSALSATSLSHLKFRHLLLIDYLRELGTLHKAAKALNISQPAATAMLSDLEALLGVALFERSHRGVQPTELGRQLMDSLSTLLNEYHHFAESLGQLVEGRDRMLRVGLVPQAFAAYLPRVIQQFRATCRSALRVQEGTAAQLLDLVWEGQLDCVIGRLPNSGFPQHWDASALRFENLYSERICVVAGGKPADIKAAPYSLEWLSEQQWVLQRPDSSVRLALNEAFLRHGLAPPLPIVETSNYSQSLALIGNTGFFAVAPRRAAEIQQAVGAFHILDFELGVAPMQVSVIHRAASKNNPQLEAFKACFRRVLRDDAQSASGQK